MSSFISSALLVLLNMIYQRDLVNKAISLVAAAMKLPTELRKEYVMTRIQGELTDALSTSDFNFLIESALKYIKLKGLAK